MPRSNDPSLRTNPGGAGPNYHEEWTSQAKAEPAPDRKVIVEIRKTDRGVFVAAVKDGDDGYTANNRTLAGAMKQIADRLTDRGVFDGE